jgi:hypothetical protein
MGTIGTGSRKVKSATVNRGDSPLPAIGEGWKVERARHNGVKGGAWRLIDPDGKKSIFVREGLAPDTEAYLDKLWREGKSSASTKAADVPPATSDLAQAYLNGEDVSKVAETPTPASVLTDTQKANYVTNMQTTFYNRLRRVRRAAASPEIEKLTHPGTTGVEKYVNETYPKLRDAVGADNPVIKELDGMVADYRNKIGGTSAPSPSATTVATTAPKAATNTAKAGKNTVATQEELDQLVKESRDYAATKRAEEESRTGAKLRGDAKTEFNRTDMLTSGRAKALKVSLKSLRKQSTHCKQVLV